jgi:hypothetical protein
MRTWRISLSAVHKFQALYGRGPTEFESREVLTSMAEHCLLSSQTPRELDNGSIQYRGPRPLRLRLIVRREGDELVLVDVLPDNEKRFGRYLKSRTIKY